MEPTETTESPKPPPRQVFTFEGDGQIIDELHVKGCALLFIQVETRKGTAREVRARFPDGFELILAAAGPSG